MSPNSFLISSDMSDLCRVCLQLPEESQYLDLTTIYDEEENLTYGECFTICTQINLSDGEGVPHHLCKSCGLELQMTYDFYKKVEESKRMIEQCQKQVKEQRLNASAQQNTSCDMKQHHDTDLSLTDKYVTSECLDTVMPRQEESALGHHQKDILISNTQEKNNDHNMETELREQKEDVVFCDSIHVESSEQSIVDADIEEHLDMEDYQSLETLEEEEKLKNSIKKCKIKKEFEDDTLTENSTSQLQNMKTTVPNEILSRNNIENVISNEIKIEDEIISDYIVSSPTIMSDIYPPIPTHIVSSRNNSRNKTTEGNIISAVEPSFECDVCGYILPTKNALYQHRQRKHNEKKQSHHQNKLLLKCRLCSKSFAVVSSLRLHLHTEHNMGFACEHCGYNLPTKNALYQHRLRKHRNIERKHKHFAIKLKCIQSAESLKTQEGPNISLENQRSSKKRRGVPESGNWIECNECGYKLPTRNALYQHRLRKHRNR